MNVEGGGGLVIQVEQVDKVLDARRAMWKANIARCLMWSHVDCVRVCVEAQTTGWMLVDGCGSSLQA